VSFEGTRALIKDMESHFVTISASIANALIVIKNDAQWYDARGLKGSSSLFWYLPKWLEST